MVGTVIGKVFAADLVRSDFTESFSMGATSTAGDGQVIGDCQHAEIEQHVVIGT